VASYQEVKVITKILYSFLVSHTTDMSIPSNLLDFTTLAILGKLNKLIVPHLKIQV